MIQQGLTGADPGFFSVRGAPLRNGLAKKFTSQYKLIRANTKKKASTQEGPHHPPPRSAPVLVNKRN